MTETNRREAIGALSLGATLALSGRATAQTGAPAALPPAFAGAHPIKPLTFDPAQLTGLSERLIKSHWENNYQGSVRTLNMIEGRIAAALSDKDLPAAILRGLKREHLNRTGSVVLHELYFGALGGDGKAAGDIKSAINLHWGSFALWETEFRKTAMALAGGSGWAVLAFNLHTGTLANHWAADHMHQPPASLPLITLDMYEHAFHIDYGAAAARYVDAFMANLNWQEVDRRFRKARPALT